MRIAYVTTILTPNDDAQSIQVQAMARVFHEALGKDFVFVSPEYERNKETTVSFSWKRIRVHFLRPRFLRYILFLVGSRSTVFAFEPDWIYTRDIGVGFVYTILGYRVAYEMHKPFSTWIGDTLFRLLSRRISCITISDALQEYVSQKYAMSLTQTVVARDGVFLENFFGLDKEKSRDLLLKELSVGKEACVVMYSGNLYPGKGLEVIVSAAERIPDAVFVVVGLNTLGGAEKPYPQNLFFLGRKDTNAIPRYLSGADFLILPFTKNWDLHQWHSALKMFEYMASGVPIIASNVGATREVLTEKNSYVFDPSDVGGLVATMTQIRDNKSQAFQRSAQALHDVQDFSWQKRVEKILGFLSTK